MFLIDENLSPKLGEVISSRYEAAIHTGDCDLSNSPDLSVWEYAKENTLIILTKDHDFHHLSNAFGCPPKVIRLACGNQPTRTIIKIFLDQIEAIDSFISSPDLCYLEITCQS